MWQGTKVSSEVMGGELTVLTGAAPGAHPMAKPGQLVLHSQDNEPFISLPTSSYGVFLSKPGIVDQVMIFSFFAPSKDQINKHYTERSLHETWDSIGAPEAVALGFTKNSYKQNQNLHTNSQMILIQAVWEFQFSDFFI